MPGKRQVGAELLASSSDRLFGKLHKTPDVVTDEHRGYLVAVEGLKVGSAKFIPRNVQTPTGDSTALRMGCHAMLLLSTERTGLREIRV